MVMSVAHLHLNLSCSAFHHKTHCHLLPPLTPSLSLPFPSTHPSSIKIHCVHLQNLKRIVSSASTAGGNGSNGTGGRSGGGGGGDGDGNNSESSSSSSAVVGVLGLFLSGWKSRVAADPQFPFKVLMEELVGLSACIIGDMSCRPNFGLNELDFVFSTLVVGSILNFLLMYLLAPTAASPSVTPKLVSIFSSCPTGHMFEPGSYTILDRFGTLVYKGLVFAAVGFAAGLVGTGISNGLMKMRMKMDPSFESQNKPPPTLLNSLTWAAHMGFSSNFRYQTLNGIEFLLEKCLPSLWFKSSVTVLRCFNNVLGGMTFVTLAKLTGSQSSTSQNSSVNVVTR